MEINFRDLFVKLLQCYFYPEKASEAFQLPKNEEVLTFIALGYAAEKAEPLPNHFNRKPIEQTVSYL